MRTNLRRELHADLKPFHARSTARALAILGFDLLAYGGAIAGVLLVEPLAVKILLAVAAGSVISSLFVIGHDAAHGAFTGSAPLNAIIGRLAFLPSLHNYSLWQVAHNRLHHSLTNFKGKNSWSPMSKAEYDRLPPWRRAVERIYRSPPGLGLYYLVERWWKDKFFPSKRITGRHQRKFWLDFALLAGWLLGFLALLAGAASVLPQTTVAEALVLGFVVPFAIWNTAMGWTVYLQHTHPRIPWFRDTGQWVTLVHGQEEVTPYIRFPRWFGRLVHDINEHTAHHVAPKIPLYHIYAAQQVVAAAMGERLVSERFTLAGFLTNMAACKLYDYDRHVWTDFAGNVTSECTLPLRAGDETRPIDIPAAAAA